MRKRITYRPSKAEGLIGMVTGIIFVLLGVFVVIPQFGPFGILWTLTAVGITAANGYRTFGKKYVGPEIHVEEDGAPPESFSGACAGDAKARLEQLETLREAGLITPEEYQQKRQDILRSL